MAILGIVMSVIKPALVSKTPTKLSKYGIMACAVAVRNVSSMEVNKNITLITLRSSDPKKKIIVKGGGNLKLEQTDQKPLVVMLSWLMARRKHIFKYADFYLKRGFDVMNISITPWQLLWPVKGTQVVAADILKFLDLNHSYQPLIIHGFSVGGYLWSEAMVQMAADLERYQPILNRIVGQVWDSLADVTEMPEGLPVAVFPKNKVLQSALKQYILYHLNTFDKVATCHYVRASQIFHTNIVRAPALFFVSKADPIGSVKSNQRARESWENMGIQCQWKIWDETPHVGHYRKYPQEYISELTQFIESIGLQPGQRIETDQRAQVKAKL